MAKHTDGEQGYAGAVSVRAQVDSANTVVPAEYVEEHNVYRCEVGLEPLAWDSGLAAVAQEWADHQAENANCRMAHSTNSWRNGAFATVGYPDHAGASGWVGENLVWLSGYMPSGDPQIKDGREITGMWASEKADFNLGPSSDSCTKDGGRAVGHYTQMVWHSTRKIGCGVSQCSDGASLFVCQYWPGGNMMGELPFCKAGKPADMDECAGLASESDPPGASESCVTRAGSCGSDGSVCTGDSGSGAGEETCGGGGETPTHGCACGEDSGVQGSGDSGAA